MLVNIIRMIRVVNNKRRKRKITSTKSAKNNKQEEVYNLKKRIKIQKFNFDCTLKAINHCKNKPR